VAGLGVRAKELLKLLEDQTFANNFGLEVVIRNRIFDRSESSEKIISVEPPIQKGSNLYGSLDWRQGWVSDQNDFQNSLKIRL